MFQEYGRSLFPWMRVGQNVGLPLRQKRLSRERRRALVADALESVGLADDAGAYPWQRSGGMQQRVAIARAPAYEPEVLLTDEPFAAVDAQTRAELEDLVRRLWRERRITIPFVTHDIDEAVYLGERVLVLSASPTVVQEQLKVGLPAERDRLRTRVDPRFAELRTRVAAPGGEARPLSRWRPAVQGAAHRPRTCPRCRLITARTASSSRASSASRISRCSSADATSRPCSASAVSP